MEDTLATLEVSQSKYIASIKKYDKKNYKTF